MTNRQIHEECADMLYGDNMFVICVGFDSIKFLYQWVVEPKRAPRSRREAALVPKGEKAFLDHFSQRNLLRIKNYIINVELLDSYTGMIKHNCGGNGLAYGIREQVETLVELLVLVPYLQQVHIYLANERYKARPSNTRRRREPVPLDEQQDLLAEAVLSPFTRLFEVRKAKVTGVREDQAELLEQSMMAPRNVGT